MQPKCCVETSLKNKKHKVILRLGYSCNNNCLFCHSRSRQGNLSFVQASKKIDLIKGKNVGCVLISGGEPTIRKDIFKLIDYSKLQGLDFGLVTNARMLSSPDFLKRLVERDIKCIYTTLHSYKKEIHNKISCSDSFEQTVKGIKNVVNSKIWLLVNVVITKDNLEDIEKTVEFLTRLKVDNMKLSFVEPVTKENMVHIPSIEKTAQKVKSVLEKDPNCGWDGFPLCLMRGFKDRIVNLRTSDVMWVSEVWEEKFYPSDEGNKIKPEICKKCEEKRECEGIYRVYYENRKVNLQPLVKPS